MISKKDMRSLIKTIKEKTGKTQEQISIGAGYKQKTLTQLLSKNESLETAYNHLKLIYQRELNNSTQDNDINISLIEISKALARIENGQVYIRAEVRGYGQFQIMEKVQWDQKKFLQAMDKVGKLVGANISADDLQGS
jgi:transcriptional regulator with XRE-family HTH domain